MNPLFAVSTSANYHAPRKQGMIFFTVLWPQWRNPTDHKLGVGLEFVLSRLRFLHYILTTMATQQSQDPRPRGKIKRTTALAVGGITLAGAFVVIAIVSPKSLDWILHPGEERSDQIKQEMERQKGIDPNGQSSPPLRREGESKSGAKTPTPSPEETARSGEGEIRGDERIPKPECISRDQVVKIIGASEEAREGRVIWINVAPDGHRVMVAYRKRTFLGIGSGENQIEGILRRGLRNRFPDRLIKSLKVQSDGKRSVRQGVQSVNAEVLEIETLQAGCRWP